MKRLPKQLFVKIDGTAGEEYFNAADKAEYLVDMGEAVKIGKYELVEIADAIGVAQIVPTKARRRR